jgi:hypothetical protein
MNSAGFVGSKSRGCHSPLYNAYIMTTDDALYGYPSGCRREGNSLRQARLGMAEVQICGIPKLSLGEVAPTP